MPTTVSPSGLVMFRSREKSPTVRLSDGIVCRFRNYHFQTADPATLEALRKALPKLGSHVTELEVNPIEKVKADDRSLKAENENLKAEIQRLAAAKRRGRPKKETEG